jgi:glycerol-3-phosphate O-acyltransferase/dihydroxyacetone phosphate acyltransferase
MTDTKDAAEAKKPPKQLHSPQNKSSAFIYDLILWTLARINSPPNQMAQEADGLLVMVDIFFREIRSRGSYRIPRRGAVIFVAAPHANQVYLDLDPL